jgi:N-acetylneuraminic acid mutarotase
MHVATLRRRRPRHLFPLLLPVATLIACGDAARDPAPPRGEIDEEGEIPPAQGFDDVPDDPDEVAYGRASSGLVSTTPWGFRSMASFAVTGDDPPVMYASTAAGRRLFLWGGMVWDQRYWEGTISQPSAVASTRGYLYDVATNIWSKLPSVALSPHIGTAHAVWTGKRVYLWAPSNSTAPAEGASYTPDTGSWYKLPPPPSRMQSGTEMVWSQPPDGPGRLLFWGASTCGTVNGTGMRYRPSTHTWSWMKKSPLETRQGHRMIWTGTRMIVWGGHRCGQQGQALSDGASYDPQTNTWQKLTAAPIHGRARHLLAWGAPSDARAFVWGGTYEESTTTFAPTDGAAFDPATSSWSSVPSPSFPYPPRLDPFATWAGDRIFVFGGWRWEAQANEDLGDTAIYDPASKSWTSVSGGPSPRQRGFPAWTGQEVIVWGGEKDTPKGLRPLGDGALYGP